MKDLFTKQSEAYAKFRPSYPREIFDFLVTQVRERNTAWDCATGNGQVAASLAEHFKEVYATDISEGQLSKAIQKPNIVYRIEAAEKSSFNDSMFDLITVAQAIHWFNFEKFYSEVKRTLKPEGIFAVIGYTLPKVDEEVDSILTHFYENTLHGYWDDERKYIDEMYLTIPFPFHELQAPIFIAQYFWEAEQLIGFLNSWSAVQHYINKNNSNPVDLVADDLRKCWRPNSKKTIIFPMMLRVGRK
jgi:ubiquinone/menaquinone biosynthesis C-methylase UbiE